MSTDTTTATTTPTTRPATTPTARPVATPTARPTLEACIDAVLSAYCDPDSQRRAAVIADVWTDDGELVDPPLEGRGHAELSALADAVLAGFPDHIFRRTSALDVHHGRGRYSWDLVAPTGTVGVSGVDFVEFADDGKVRRITGFFGALEPAA